MFTFEFSELNEQIRQLAKKFTQEEIAPGVIDRDVNAEFPVEILKKLGEIGFMGIMASPDYGGSGMDTISCSIALEEICKVDASIGIMVSVHNSLVNWIFENYGTEELKQKYLPRLTSGSLLGAYCLSEPEAGSDASHQNTLAEKDGEYWILNGMKNWVSSGHYADLYVVFAQTDASAKYKGITAFAVDKETEGFEPMKKEDKMGMRSSDTTSIALTNVKVHESNIIGNVGQGFYIAMEGLNSGRIGIASQSLGIAVGAYEAAVRYSKQRQTFNKPIIEHQIIGAKLAQMAMKIDAARLLIYKAAYLKDTHQNFIQASSEAKLFASTAAFDIAREAVQIHGGYGYTREYHVERMLRDAKVTEIYEGTSEIQHIVIAREIMKSDI
jgi:alkylation response protein AidB-like acyl-CoA dehydrogenase